MQTAVDITRRSFLVHAGRGTVALAVLGVVGCRPAAISSGNPSASSSTGPTSGSSASPGPSGTTGEGSGSAPPSTAAGGVTWQRANLGFVSAYVLVGEEAAIVDTGVGGSDGAIHDALIAAAVDWAGSGT